MNNLRKAAAGLAVAAAVSVSGVSLTSSATAATPAPCSAQQTHADKAQAKLDWITQKFAAQSAKVKQDRKAVAATKGSAQAQARKKLALDKAKKVKIAKAKKAQQHRLAHAQAALAKCQAANPAPSASPTAA